MNVNYHTVNAVASMRITRVLQIFSSILVFACIFSFDVHSVHAAEPWVETVSPNGGETWEVGKTYTVVWRYRNIDTIHTIGIVQDGTKHWDDLIFLNLT